MQAIGHRVAIARAEFAYDAAIVEVELAEGAVAENPDMPAGSRRLFQRVGHFEVFEQLDNRPGRAVINVDASEALRRVQNAIEPVVRQQLVKCGRRPVRERSFRQLAKDNIDAFLCEFVKQVCFCRLFQNGCCCRCRHYVLSFW